MNISSILKTSKLFLKSNQSSILTGASVAGVVFTSALSARGYYKAKKELEFYEDEVTGENKLNFKEKAKLTWKYYIPPVLMGATTIACIISVHITNTKQKAAITAAWTASNALLKDFEAKAIDELGGAKVQKIKDSIAKDVVEKNPPKEDQTIVINGDNGVLCLDSWTGRYFKTTVESVKRAQNNVNYKIISGGDYFVSLNEFYSEIGLDGVISGDNIGWTTDNTLEINFSTQLTEDGVPVMVVSFAIEPAQWTHLGR